MLPDRALSTKDVPARLIVKLLNVASHELELHVTLVLTVVDPLYFKTLGMFPPTPSQTPPTQAPSYLICNVIGKVPEVKNPLASSST